jgi:hypothetical protein
LQIVKIGIHDAAIGNYAVISYADTGFASYVRAVQVDVGSYSDPALAIYQQRFFYQDAIAKLYAYATADSNASANDHIPAKCQIWIAGRIVFGS